MVPLSTSTSFCRDCLEAVSPEATRCPACKSPRILQHSELPSLAIAHIDCDAFYASVEKRDDPNLRDKPVIIGGGKRGVVSTACYIARIHGVKSAMPMFKALALCPEAVVIKPNMAKYAEAGKKVRELMLQLTPLVQPLSIDEAFLDLSGTERLYQASPALSLARLTKRIEKEVGVTVSVGLSHNKFLAKLASDLQKPKGFSVIGRAETKSILAPRPVTAIWGVGPATQSALAKKGITHIHQLQQIEKNDLIKVAGSLGARLYHLSRGEDYRDVDTTEESKSVSAETTFNEDLSAYADLEAELWRLCQRVSRRAKKEGVAGKSITLKLKTVDFESRTRARSVQDATNLAHVLFDVGKQLLAAEVGREKFRLIGIGISRIEEGALNEPTLDQRHATLTNAELAMDKIREKFGPAAVDKGIGLRQKSGR